MIFQFLQKTPFKNKKIHFLGFLLCESPSIFKVLVADEQQKLLKLRGKLM